MIKDPERANIITEALSGPRGRRKLAWAMTEPMMGGINRPLPWEGYPDSPTGTLEVIDEVNL